MRMNGEKWAKLIQNIFIIDEICLLSLGIITANSRQHKYKKAVMVTETKLILINENAFHHLGLKSIARKMCKRARRGGSSL